MAVLLVLIGGTNEGPTSYSVIRSHNNVHHIVGDEKGMAIKLKIITITLVGGLDPRGN